ncbi:cytochrome P450 [Mycobacterium branderi]|uniref:Cytochrome P450 n=1 Tax=Mycobacterium branderi TaxID=43348 RepID=A0A7I7W6P5_9MYCO|nr:cytochrome P450 [Mycobacterium branderi]MCV7234395.1 cytochrome P450 [Mycobacterium branderi]ORA38449.1 cytochrome P450 [Mycobacterium branderi]BBZ13239.1 cytochrome P450 [Mycobacterium branderi]
MTVDEFDPAELQGSLLMQVENVHERLREARAKHRVMVGNPFSETSSQTLGSAGMTVLGYDECQTVLTHPDTFSSAIYEQIMGPVMGRTLLELEGAEHRASRALVSPSFRSALLERWRSELVEVVVHELIDRFAPRGRAELAREFTFAFPVQVIARMMGLPREDYLRFQRLSIELLNVVYDWECGIAASAELKAYFGEILAARRRDPQDDLISTLAESEIDGARLTDDEIFAFLLLILPAGVETTYRASGNLLVGLLTEPLLWEAVRADRGLVHGAIEEALRWEPPITTVMRRAAHDCELGGVAIPAGTNVSVSVAAANRDPARYPDPDRFDPTRKGIAHLTFGGGPHLCLGMHLARMESTVAINALLDRLPDLRLDPSEPPPHVVGVAFRSPAALPVQFSPS